MRILLLSRYADLGASSRVRYLQYLPYLEHQGMYFTVVPLFSNRYLKALYEGNRAWLEIFKGYFRRVLSLLRARQFDVLIIEKELFPFLPAIAERILHWAGVPYLVDYDDAIFHNYDHNSNWWIRTLLGRKIDKVMQLSNAVMVGNQYLAQRAHSAGAKRVEIVSTVVDSERYFPRIKCNRDVPLIVGWIGTPKTSHYLKPLLPTFEHLQSRYRVRFVAVGANEKDFVNTPIEAWAWSEASEIPSIQQFDIGIMPLLDSPWERGKCGYKLIQYMACGLPVVASPIGVNSEIVLVGENGFLANTASEWVDTLSRLLSNTALRQKMGKAGRKRVVEKYCIQQVVPRLAALLRTVWEGH